MATSIHSQKYTPEEVRAAAEKVGISPDSMRKRLQKGMTLREAASIPKRTPRECGNMTPAASRIPYDREEIAAAAKEVGIKYDSFMNRLHRGMSLEEAKRTKRMSKGAAARKGKNVSPWKNEKICRGSITDWDNYWAGRR